MNKMFFATLFISLSSLAHSRNYDGCYQLLDTGVMYPAICISGTTEEGIGGAGARLAIFGANTNILKACLKSSSLTMSNSNFEFIIDGRKELVLSKFSADGISGEAMVGKTRMKFVRLTENESRPLTDSAYRGNCL